MNFLTKLFQLLVEFVDTDFLAIWFFPALALAFLATVPAIIRFFISR